MDPTWESLWSKVEEYSGFGKREGQTRLGEAVFENVFNGGQLCAEGPTGTGKSLALLIPAIAAFQEKKQRTIVTTETISLLDQIVDKDLPFLQAALGKFSYFGLKGRNHYLCIAKAGRNHPTVQALGSRIDGTLGERRDVERILGRRLDDEDWSDICGDTEFCAHNKCASEVCYSTAAKEKALKADIVVTSHTMLQIHGEFVLNGFPDGLLGEFHHIMVDEAHSLEKVVVSGATFEVAPWDIHKKLETISKGVAVVRKDELVGFVDEMEKRIRDSITIIHNLMEFQVGPDTSVNDWARECMPLGLIYIHGASIDHILALDAYEETLPELLNDIVDLGGRILDIFKKEMEGLERGKGKVSKAMSAVSSLSSVFGLINSTVRVREGTVDAYGTTYALFADGFAGRDVNRRPKKDIIIRAVPLDVSNFLRTNLWTEARSVTVVSATLRDMSTCNFKFVKRSLGLRDTAKECIVDSPFDFATQQLMYLTDGDRDDLPDISGVRFSESELVDLIKATEGRSLVLFTSMKELSYVADLLRGNPEIPWTVLVQEKGEDKSELARRFKEDTHSILLGSNSFVQGFDVPGEALTHVILVKWFNPRYDPVMKAQIRHWRDRGFPQYYTMRSLETTVQALGRGVRSSDCKVVCSILDNRVAGDKETVRGNALHVLDTLYPSSPVTSDIAEVKRWTS